MNANTLLVTGASSDIATQLISLLLRENNGQVLAHFHKGAERIRQLQDTFPSSIVPIAADLSRNAEVGNLIQEVQRKIGFPRQIVHFAGLKLRLERWSQTDTAHLKSNWDIQVGSIIQILQAFLPLMSKCESRTKVVFVLSSVTVGITPKFMASYALIKHAQLGLMRALASEYSGTGVNINAVSPSMVETRFLADLPSKAIEIAAAQNPNRRNVTRLEVAEVIKFLLSPQSDSLTGLNIPVTGGAAQ